jgi:hypothetical protein
MKTPRYRGVFVGSAFLLQLSSLTFVVNYDERVFDDMDVMAVRGLHAVWSITGADARRG